MQNKKKWCPSCGSDWKHPARLCSLRPRENEATVHEWVFQYLSSIFSVHSFPESSQYSTGLCMSARVCFEESQKVEGSATKK